MPLYEVEHIRALTEQQQDDLAEAITQIHADQFGAIRLFVNVRFTDVSKHRVYVAGKRVGYSTSYSFSNFHFPSRCVA